MINVFMRSPLSNTLAILVLLALIVTWITSVVRGLESAPVNTERGWYAALLPAFSVLAIPAAIDLLLTKGVTVLFAGVVLLILVANIVVPILRANGKASYWFLNDWYRWSILFCVVGGLIVAGYLVYIKFIGGQVSCGPSGGCDTVQNSRYATLFGVLPVAVLGLVGYIGILTGWLAWQLGPAAIRRTAAVAIWGMCLFGALFSIYLTSLEPFVIGATCMWCIVSAVLMTMLLLLSTPAAQEVLALPEMQPELAEEE